MREAGIQRKTKETNISLNLCIDGTGQSSIDTGCGFLDHMLELFARHGRMDLMISCRGDVQVDYHHTVEDIGIVLGQALAKAAGEKRGICRYGDILLPMDEALIMAAVDISGRSHLSYELTIPTQKVGDMDTELVEEFFEALTRNAGITLHLRSLAGKNSHHIIEGAFKAVGRVLKKAYAIDNAYRDEIPSTKGIL